MRRMTITRVPQSSDTVLRNTPGTSGRLDVNLGRGDEVVEPVQSLEKVGNRRSRRSDTPNVNLWTCVSWTLAVSRGVTFS